MSPNSKSKRRGVPLVPKFDTQNAFNNQDRRDFNVQPFDNFANPTFNLNQPVPGNIHHEDPKFLPSEATHGLAPPGVNKAEFKDESSHSARPIQSKVPAFVPDINLQLINKLYAAKDLANKDKKDTKKPAPAPTEEAVSHQIQKLKDEYDPARPNDYEVVLEERRKKQAEEEEQKLRQFERMEEDEQDYIGLNEAPNFSKYPKMEEEPPQEVEEEPTMDEKMLKILEKQGWKMGEGLGKNRQGMTTPLIAKKTTANTAVIVNSVMDMTAVLPPEVVAKKAREAQYNIPPTKVLVFLNMVSPHDNIDEQLRDEVIDECQNFGRVLSCEVYEMKNLPEDQTIRIFVEFEKKENAINAFASIHGRFFGGRSVVCKFYDEAAYGVRELHLPL